MQIVPVVLLLIIAVKADILFTAKLDVFLRGSVLLKFFSTPSTQYFISAGVGYKKYLFTSHEMYDAFDIFFKHVAERLVGRENV